MRRTPLALAAALIFAGAAAPAQTRKPDAGPRPNMVTGVVRASLRGIPLTDAEKASLAKISEAYTPKFKALGQSARPLMAKLKTARAAHDTATAHATRRELVGLRQRGMTTLRSSLLEIRAVLTPEQQVTFDANAVRVRRMIRSRVASRPLSPPGCKV